MIGIAKRHETLRMSGGAKNPGSVGDIHRRIDRAMKDQERFTQFSDRLASVMAGEILEQLPSDPEFPPAQKDLRFTPGFYFSARGGKQPLKVLWLIRGTDCSHRGRLRYTAGGGKHRRPPKAVSDQQCRCREAVTQKVCRCDQVGNIGGEVRVGKVAAAAAETGEIKAQDRYTSRCELAADVNRGKTVLRARKAVRKQRVSPGCILRTIQVR